MCIRDSPDRARRLHGPLAHDIGEALWRCDPVADAFADVVGREPAAFAELERALRHGLPPAGSSGAPRGDVRPELAQLLDAVSHVPEWVSFGAVRRGGDVFLRTGILGGFVLGGVSLMAGYASPAGNKPLAMSGRLEGQVSRRLAETARFVWAVSKPDGMRRDTALDGLAMVLVTLFDIPQTVALGEAHRGVGAQRREEAVEAIPVSYTHLDVYKRQEERGGWDF